MWFNGTHFVNSIYRHLFPWILLGLAQVFILPYGKSKEMTDRLQGWTQFVFFKEMSFAASLGPICMYTARWREFKGSKVSCSRKQCNDKAWIHIYLNHYVSWERSGPGQPKCESCSPKRPAGIQIFFLSPVIAKRQHALCIQVVVQFHSCFKFWFPSVCFTIISIGNSMICSNIWHKYHEWYFKIVIQKSLSLSLKYHEWYLCQISRTNHAIICLYHYPQKVCNFHI